MNLFEFKNHDVFITDEVRLIPAFKAVYDKYTEDEIEQAITEFKFIFFMTDYRSDFESIVNIDEREEMVLSAVVAGSPFIKDEITAEAISRYDTTQSTPSMRLVKAGRTSMSKIETFLNDVDLTLMDGNGKPIYSIKMVADVIGSLSKMTTALNELEATVKREMDEGSRIRGGGTKGFFEDV